MNVITLSLPTKNTYLAPTCQHAKSRLGAEGRSRPKWLPENRIRLITGPGCCGVDMPTRFCLRETRGWPVGSAA